jgi:hypothetical protein
MSAPNNVVARRQPAHRRNDDYIVHIERVLAENGVSDFEYQPRRNNHRSVVIRHRGKQRFVVFPLTGGDWRGPRNTASDVRRVIHDMEAA